MQENEMEDMVRPWSDGTICPQWHRVILTGGFIKSNPYYKRLMLIWELSGEEARDGHQGR